MDVSGHVSRVASSVAPKVFSFLARGYDFRPLQALVYRSNHNEVMAELTRLGPDVVVDVGCGTGVLTARIAAELRPSRLVGCDAAEGMLAKARARNADVEWVLTHAESLPLDDECADAVVCTEAFHFFDQPSALAEFRRILRPAGSVVVVSVLTTRGQMSTLIAGAGLELVEHRMARRLPGLPASLVTVARRPA
jgi:ubiquinone/menaquinone biosynthesis C-methylase UbiE